MKILVLLSLVLLGASSSQASVETDILTCSHRDLRPGAPVYVVKEVLSPVPGRSTNRYIIEKRSLNPGGGTFSVWMRNSRASKVQYGSTFILTFDMGRSGFAHFYKSGDDPMNGTSIVEINLFDQEGQHLNTDRPLTDYVCVESYGTLENE